MASIFFVKNTQKLLPNLPWEDPGEWNLMKLCEKQGQKNRSVLTLYCETQEIGILCSIVAHSPKRPLLCFRGERGWVCPFSLCRCQMREGWKILCVPFQKLNLMLWLPKLFEGSADSSHKSSLLSCRNILICLCLLSEHSTQCFQSIQHNWFQSTAPNQKCGRHNSLIVCQSIKIA